MQDAAIGFGSAVSLFLGRTINLADHRSRVPLAAAVWCVGILCLLAFFTVWRRDWDHRDRVPVHPGKS